MRCRAMAMSSAMPVPASPAPWNMMRWSGSRPPVTLSADSSPERSSNAQDVQNGTCSAMSSWAGSTQTIPRLCSREKTPILTTTRMSREDAQRLSTILQCALAKPRLLTDLFFPAVQALQTMGYSM